MRSECGALRSPRDDGENGTAATCTDVFADPVWIGLLSDLPEYRNVLGLHLDHADPRAGLRSLRAALSTAPPVTAVVVICERRCLRTLAQRHGRLDLWFALPSLRKVTTAMRDNGFVVDSGYLAWPSLEQRRVVAPTAWMPWRWAQHAGVLGGGRTAPLRSLFRSSLFSPFVRSFASGLVVTGWNW